MSKQANNARAPTTQKGTETAGPAARFPRPQSAAGIPESLPHSSTGCFLSRCQKFLEGVSYETRSISSGFIAPAVLPHPHTHILTHSHTPSPPAQSFGPRRVPLAAVSPPIRNPKSKICNPPITQQLCRPWSKLDDTYKTANREQARYAVKILESCGFVVRPAANPNAPDVFTGNRRLARQFSCAHRRCKGVKRLRKKPNIALYYQFRVVLPSDPM